jgi:hypothetical protein
MPLYIVRDRDTGIVRLIEAKRSDSAIKFVTGDRFTAEQVELERAVETSPAPVVAVGVESGITICGEPVMVLAADQKEPVDGD